MDGRKILYKGGEGEIVEKKSRFIATLRPIASEEEAAQFLAEIRKKYWDARHHCSAFVLGERGDLTRCSDDGEPGSTAGVPLLTLLERNDIEGAGTSAVESRPVSRNSRQHSAAV